MTWQVAKQGSYAEGSAQVHWREMASSNREGSYLLEVVREPAMPPKLRVKEYQGSSREWVTADKWPMGLLPEILSMLQEASPGTDFSEVFGNRESVDIASAAHPLLFLIREAVRQGVIGHYYILNHWVYVGSEEWNVEEYRRILAPAPGSRISRLERSLRNTFVQYGLTAEDITNEVAQYAQYVRTEAGT